MSHTHFTIGDRVKSLDRKLGELTGTVIGVSDSHITVLLDHKRKKQYPTDREDEVTSFKRYWSLIPHFEIKTDDGSCRVYNHRSAPKATSSDLDEWEEDIICQASSQY